MTFYLVPPRFLFPLFHFLWLQGQTAALGCWKGQQNFWRNPPCPSSVYHPCSSPVRLRKWDCRLPISLTFWYFSCSAESRLLHHRHLSQCCRDHAHLPVHGSCNPSRTHNVARCAGWKRNDPPEHNLDRFLVFFSLENLFFTKDFGLFVLAMTGVAMQDASATPNSYRCRTKSATTVFNSVLSS